MKTKKILLVPLDPVHDVGLKMIKGALEERGHEIILLPPDEELGSIIDRAQQIHPDVILISRTIGYQVAEELGRFIDLADATGIRQKSRMGIGGMAINPELAAELGFDGGFGPDTTIEEAVAFVEGRSPQKVDDKYKRRRVDLTRDFDYSYRHSFIEELLNHICQDALTWSQNRSSPGIKRAQIRGQLLEEISEKGKEELKGEYLRYCDEDIVNYYQQGFFPGVKRVPPGELQRLHSYLASLPQEGEGARYQEDQPRIMVQYGTGCPVMDIAHIKISEAWGADGVIHFDPAWGSRREGLLEGVLTHAESGTVISWENLQEIKGSLFPETLWQVRAHRGLNTPETVLLAGEARAHLTKINVAYGSLGGGTDPERLLVDSITGLKYAASYRLPFDLPTNEELSGVPAGKAFAGMLITAHLGILLQAHPILQPLFCYSPDVMVKGLMQDNYMEFNIAKILALREIINAPIWPGAPVGFMTHSEERVQSSVSTTLHGTLAAGLGVQAITIASSDEAYAGGAITASSRVDTLQGIKEGFRFLGSQSFPEGERVQEMKEQLIEEIEDTLKKVKETGFLKALYQGSLGSPAEGAYPGRHGKGSVFSQGEQKDL